MSARRGWFTALLSTAVLLGLVASLTPWLPAWAATAWKAHSAPKEQLKVTTSAQKKTGRTLAPSLQAAAEKGGPQKVDVLVMLAKGSPKPPQLEYAVRVTLKGAPSTEVFAGKVRASKLTKLATAKGVRLVADNGNRTPPPPPDLSKPSTATVKAAAARQAVRMAQATRSGSVKAWAQGFDRGGTRSDSGAAAPASAGEAIVSQYAALGSAFSGGSKFAAGWFDVLADHRSSYAWAKGHTGAGVKVAVVDEGVDFGHPDLQGTEATVPVGSSNAGWPMAFDPYSCLLLAYDDSYGTDYIASGGSWFSDTASTVASGSAVEFDGLTFNTTGLSAPSKSGTYHIGYLNDENLEMFATDGDYMRPAVLVSDPNVAGVYDTVYVDLNFDKIFFDDKVCTKGGGTAPISYLDFWDSAHQFPAPDGYADISGGMVYWIADGASAPPGYEPAFGPLSNDPAAGTMVAFMGAMDYQFDHGTLCASGVAAQGRINGVSGFEGSPAAFPSFKGSGTGGMVKGAGRDVGVVGIGDMYNAFSLSSLLSWDFCAYGPDGDPDTGDEVQIASNSFGESDVFNPEWDYSSRYIDALNVGDGANTTYVTSTGNGGPGYGTTTPARPTTGISVGASTQYGSTGYPFDSAITTSQITYGDVAPFSNRGPTAMGHVGVDVVADGSFASGDEPLNMIGDGWTAWATWGGTSRSTPVAVGNLALTYQAYKGKLGAWPTYDTARMLLMNGATDQNYDTFVQGAGRVNGERSADLAAGAAGVAVSPASLSPGSWRGDSYPGYASMVAPGSVATSSLTISNPTTATQVASLEAASYVRTKTETFTVTMDSSKMSVYRFDRPDYLKEITGDIPADADLVVFRVRTPADQIDPSGELGASGDTNEIRPIVYDWTDQNPSDGKLWTDRNGNGFVNDGEIQFGEYERFTYANNSGPTTEVRVQRPLDRKHTGVYFGLQQSSRLGNLLDVTVEMSCWKRASTNMLHITGPTVIPLPAGSSAPVNVRVDAPSALGMYDGQVRVSVGSSVTVVPVAVNVAGSGADISFGGNDATSTLAPNDAVFGMQDWSWRAESGDWRLFMTDVPDATTLPDGAQWVVHTEWNHTPTDIDTLLFGPAPSYAPNFPEYNAYIGPGEIVPTGGSASAYLGAGLWGFYTATGGPAEWVAAPLSNGLNVMRLHNVVSDGASTATTFTGETGMVSSTPQQVSSTTTALAGSFNVDIGSSMDLPGFTGRAWGLTPVWDRYRTIVQDDVFQKEFDVADGAYIDARTVCPNSDIDLTVEYLDPLYGWETVAASESGSGNEQIHIVTPPDGSYRVTVFGFSVSGGEDSFRLRIADPQGTDGLALDGPMPGGLSAGGTATATADWAVARDSVDSRDAVWEGVAGFGPGVADQLLSVPVDIAYPFEVRSSTPSNNATWPVDQPITIDLTRRADPSTVTTGHVFLRNASNFAVVPATVSYDDDLARITLTPAASAGTTYTMYVTASIKAVDGTSLKPLAATVHGGNPIPVATPTFTPPAGTFSGSVDVAITCATSGAIIHYTTDGSTPDASSPTYSSPIHVTSTTTVKAIAVKSGMADSAVGSATYTGANLTPVSAAWSNPIAYDLKSLLTARFATKFSVAGVKATLTIPTKYGNKVITGTSGAAGSELLLPAWDGKMGGRKLPAANYQWTLVLTKTGYAPKTITGNLLVSNITFFLTGTTNGTFARYMNPGPANLYFSATNLTAKLSGPSYPVRQVAKLTGGSPSTVYIRTPNLLKAKANHTWSMTTGSYYYMTVVQ